MCIVQLLVEFFFCVKKLQFLIYSVAGGDFLRFLALQIVSVYFFANIARGYLFHSACFVIPDGCIVFVQFCFDVLIYTNIHICNLDYSLIFRVTYTIGCTDTIDSPDDEHEVARKMQTIEINTQKRIVRQVGHLPRNRTLMFEQQDIYTALKLKLFQSNQLVTSCHSILL